MPAPRLLRRRGVLRAGLGIGALWLLPPARACEFFTTTLRVTHPWTRASADGADSAIVCMKFDEVTVADRLIGVQTPVASGAELVGVDGGRAVDLAIPRGRDTLLTEQGTRLRLTGLTQPLELARSYPLTLHFERGGVVEADLSVDYTRFD